MKIDDLQKIRAKDATINALKEEIAGLNKYRKQQAEQIEALKALLTKAHDIIVAEATGSITSRVWQLLDEIEEAAPPQKAGNNDEQQTIT